MKEFEQMIKEGETLNHIKQEFESLVGQEVSWSIFWDFVCSLGHWDDYQLRMEENARENHSQS